MTPMEISVGGVICVSLADGAGPTIVSRIAPGHRDVYRAGLVGHPIWAAAAAAMGQRLAEVVSR